MDRRSDIARVRGLGSAKEGTSHWWAQRLTAIALVPLGIWFAVSAFHLGGADLGQFRDWLNGGANLVLMVLFVIALFHHMQLGLQVVVEDYVHTEKSKMTLLILNKLLAVLLGASAIISLLRVAFGG